MPSYSILNRIFLIISLILIACLLNLGIIVNPGYYSHDELGFGYYSQGLGSRRLTEIPWSSIFDFSVPQYRPITFNLWLLTSHFLFNYPPLFHLFVLLVCLLCGGVAAFIVWEISRDQLFSVVFFLIFSISPTTTFTAGWVCTMGDSLWVLFSLLVFLSILKALLCLVRISLLLC